MILKKISLLLLSSFLFVGCMTLSNLQTNSHKGVSESMDIYLLIGQSNMAGRAPVELEDQDTLENVFLYTGIGDKEWEKAANPLNKYSTIRKDIAMQKLGPGYSFAQVMSKASKGKQIGLIVNAKGGTKIAAWLPGTEFYNEAVSRTKTAIKFGTLKGVIWHQGEGDASKYEAYTPKMITLIEAFRAEFDLPELPFVVGQLSEDKASRIDFNKMILQLPRKINNVAVVSTKKTSTLDNTHFDAPSQHLLGERYAKALLKILRQQ